jgi:hypothetical protein
VGEGEKGCLGGVGAINGVKMGRNHRLDFVSLLNCLRNRHHVIYGGGVSCSSLVLMAWILLVWLDGVLLRGFIGSFFCFILREFRLFQSNVWFLLGYGRHCLGRIIKILE